MDNLIILYSLVLGLVVGSFLNVVIFRLPRMLQLEWKRDCCTLLDQPFKTDEKPFNLAFPCSTCPSCDHKIKPRENIPVLSYVFLKGRCSQCQTRISIRYPIIELITGLLSAFIAWQAGIGWETLFILIFTWCLIALSVIDIDHQLLPDNITLPLLWLGLLINTFHTFTTLEDAVYGAMAGYTVLWVIFWGFKLLTGKEGMGYGDFKLLAAMGAWLGWQQLPVIVFLSSLVGAVVGVTAILLSRTDRSTPIPFGPYLAAAGWLALLWGNDLIHWYLGFFNTL